MKEGKQCPGSILWKEKLAFIQEHWENLKKKVALGKLQNKICILELLQLWVVGMDQDRLVKVWCIIIGEEQPGKSVQGGLDESGEALDPVNGDSGKLLKPQVQRALQQNHKVMRSQWQNVQNRK